MKLTPGMTLQSGKYLLNQALGEEGLSITYLATQTLSNQVVVIKTLESSLQVTRSFPQLHQRFVEETRLLARSQHPSIVRVLDFFQEENLPFLVMEHVPGHTLAEQVKLNGALPEAEAIHYIRQIGSAIEIAHRNGLVHRNLKPSSIIRRPGTKLAVLVGFGIAHEVASAVNPPQTNRFDFNEFAPPKQPGIAENRFAIDLYSLSATLYYLLSARSPGTSPQLDQSWNPAIKQAILRGMTSDETRRPQTIADWLNLLPREAVPLASATALLTTPSQPAQKVEPVLEVAKKQVAPTLSTSLPVLPKSEPVKAATLQEDNLSTKRPSPVTIAPQKPPSAPKPISAILSRKLSLASMAIPLGISRNLPKFLGITSAAAVSIGVGFGLALRFSAAHTPGASFFHPDQAFPSKDWKGTLTPQGDMSDVPIEKSGAVPGDYQNNLASPRSASPTSKSSNNAPLPANNREEVAAPSISSGTPRRSSAKPIPAAPTVKSDPISAGSAPAIAPSTAPAPATSDPVPPTQSTSGTNREAVPVVPTSKNDPKL
jgi:serine/threonine protein kinase